MDWSYVAGYFDGEGCVGFHVGKRGRRTNSVTWYNTHRGSLEAIRAFIGVGQIYTGKMRGGQTKDPLALSVSNKAGLEHVLGHMIPHLIIKREAAIVLLNHLPNIDSSRSANRGKAAAVPTSVLLEWYETDRLSLAQIAKRIGVHYTAVQRVFRMRVIKCRPAGAADCHRLPKSEETKERMRIAQRTRRAAAAMNAWQLTITAGSA